MKAKKLSEEFKVLKGVAPEDMPEIDENIENYVKHIPDEAWDVDVNKEAKMITYKIAPTYEEDDAHHFEIEFDLINGYMQAVAIRKNGGVLTGFDHVNDFIKNPQAFSEAVDDWAAGNDMWQ